MFQTFKSGSPNPKRWKK